MKKIKILSIVLFSIVLLSGQETLKFDQVKFNFGEIVESDTLYEHEFIFTNESDMELEIIKVKGDWGCTIASWSTGTILPADSGSIIITFDSKGRLGKFYKKIKIYLSNKTLEMIYVKGRVIPKPKKKKIITLIEMIEVDEIIKQNISKDIIIIDFRSKREFKKKHKKMQLIFRLILNIFLRELMSYKKIKHI